MPVGLDTQGTRISMRDAHRMKEKLDLSLDNRQIVGLLLGGLVVLGAVFVIGVVVGKKLSAGDAAGNAPDLLTALDERAAALHAAQKDPALTFQDELTRKSTEPIRRDPPPPPAPKPAVDAPVAHAAVKAPLEPVDETEDELTAPAASPATTSPGPHVHPSPDPAMAEAVKTKPDAVVAVRTASSAGEGMKEAIARAQKPTEVAANGAFTLQLAASQDRAEADRFIARLREQGYAPYRVEAKVTGRGTWYRVRMGSFPTKDAAGRYLQDFKRETRLEAFVTGASDDSQHQEMKTR